MKSILSILCDRLLQVFKLGERLRAEPRLLAGHRELLEVQDLIDRFKGRAGVGEQGYVGDGQLLVDHRDVLHILHSEATFVSRMNFNFGKKDTDGELEVRLLEDHVDVLDLDLDIDKLLGDPLLVDSEGRGVLFEQLRKHYLDVVFERLQR